MQGVFAKYFFLLSGGGVDGQPETDSAARRCGQFPSFLLMRMVLSLLSETAAAAAGIVNDTVWQLHWLRVCGC